MSPQQQPRAPSPPAQTAACPSLPPLPLDAAAFRRLEIAQAVFGAWTGRGAGQAALAPLWLDGSVDLLEAFVSSGGPADELDAAGAAASPPPAIQRLAEQPSFAEFNERARSRVLSFSPIVAVQSHCNTTFSSLFAPSFLSS